MMYSSPRGHWEIQICKIHVNLLSQWGYSLHWFNPDASKIDLLWCISVTVKNICRSMPRRVFASNKSHKALFYTVWPERHCVLTIIFQVWLTCCTRLGSRLCFLCSFQIYGALFRFRLLISCCRGRPLCLLSVPQEVDGLVRQAGLYFLLGWHDLQLPGSVRGNLQETLHASCKTLWYSHHRLHTVFCKVCNLPVPGQNCWKSIFPCLGRGIISP